VDVHHDELNELRNGFAPIKSAWLLVGRTKW